MDRRKEKRVPKFATITVDGDGTVQAEGAVVNISESGMSFITVSALKQGQVIKVVGTFRLKDFSETCTVKWSKKIGEGLYRIGIAYEEDQ